MLKIQANESHFSEECAPSCEACECTMLLVTEKKSRRELSRDGFLFQCERCRMPEVVFN